MISDKTKELVLNAVSVVLEEKSVKIYIINKLLPRYEVGSPFAKEILTEGRIILIETGDDRGANALNKAVDIHVDKAAAGLGTIHPASKRLE